MATIGERINGPRCEVCGKPLKDSKYRKCRECAQKARPGGSKSVGPSSPSVGLQSRFDAYLKQLDKDGYFDANENLREELVVEQADMVAQVLVRAGVTTNQLRRFFTMSRSLEHQLDVSKDFNAIKPEIAKLQPFAAALIGKEQKAEQRTRLDALRDFIDVNAQKARESEQAFCKGFLSHFESVIAYFTLYKPK
jgi:CRISPR type III-A-associated protein Csm2